MKFPPWPIFVGFRDVEFGLERMLKFMELLGNPHLEFQDQVIHVAGTNGKGSTIAYLKAILEDNNYVTHRYISPHLIEFNERIEISNNYISDDELARLSNHCKQVAEDNNLTLSFFEGTTAIAFLAFAEYFKKLNKSEQERQIFLIETGCGGRLDATNIFDNALATIITSISLDHTEWLGETVDKIAVEKAGIIKKDTPLFIAYQHFPEALQSILKRAHDVKHEIAGKPTDSHYQSENFATAKLAIKHLFHEINVKDINSYNIKWHARLQKLSDNLYLDGGHNKEAGKKISQWLGDKKFHIICALSKDKDVVGFLNNFKNSNVEFTFINYNHEKEFYKSAELEQIALKLELKLSDIKINDIESHIKTADINEPTLICGSLYLAGTILECLN